MKRLAILAALLALFAVPAAAEAFHPLTKREAVREVKRDAFRNHDVDYFDRGPNCYRLSRYLFRCVAVVVYFDGDADCISGRVRATGPRRHIITVRMFLCE